jgi:hypothetical protein
VENWVLGRSFSNANTNTHRLVITKHKPNTAERGMEKIKNEMKTSEPG